MKVGLLGCGKTATSVYTPSMKQIQGYTLDGAREIRANSRILTTLLRSS